MPKKSEPKNFGEHFADAMAAIQRQRQEDREMFGRIFDALDRYPDRHKLRHQVARLSENSGELSVDGDHVTAFVVKGGKVEVRGEKLSEDDAVKRLAELMAEWVTKIDDAKHNRRPPADGIGPAPMVRVVPKQPLYPA